VKHTPGPWTVGKEIDSGNGRTRHLVYIRIESCKGKVSCISVYGQKPNGDSVGEKYKELGEVRHKPIISADECRANARLIAEAPNLLVALKGIMAHVESGMLVRNTSEDIDPGWAIKQLPLVMDLKAAVEAISNAEVHS
jgi:hypothetical protein